MIHKIQEHINFIIHELEKYKFLDEEYKTAKDMCVDHAIIAARKIKELTE